MAPSAPASSTSTAGGFVNAVSPSPSSVDARVASRQTTVRGSLGDEEQRCSGAVDRQSRLVGIEADGERAEVVRVESWQVVDPVTELADLEQRIWTAVVHRASCGVGRVRQASNATIRAIAATTLPKISKVVGSATCATTTPARTAGSDREL